MASTTTQRVFWSIFAVTAASVCAAATNPHVVLVVSDDLGYNDLGYKNSNKTLTPAIDKLVSEGVQMTQYYTFKLCSPTRASLQSGRYPWGVGFYDMDDARFGDDNHCIGQSTTLLPALLKKRGYSTHAIGKWDVGYIKKDCTPTFRGYDTFLGYYTACTSDYWYHGAPGGNITYSKCGGVDFHDSAGSTISGAAMHGPGSLNGTYDQEVFTNRAVTLIDAHGPDGPPMFIYLAFHSVHDTCAADKRFPGRLNAPAATVGLYAHTQLDTWKVQGAMTTELDYGVANVTDALCKSGMWTNTVFILVSDNGGPLDHSTNFPLRGGKGSLWEGGVRVEAFVTSPLLPLSMRGVQWNGLAHSSDWYVTIVEGLASGSVADTGPRPVDGHNLWPALSGVNQTSPRTEVIHRVQNRYFNVTLGDKAGAAARFGDWKIMVGVSCASNEVWQAWPELAASPVPFGLSGGRAEPGTDHLRASSLPAFGAGDGPDPNCSRGIPVDYHDHGIVTCCAKECGVCGVSSECQIPVKDGKPCPCASRPGGAPSCCVGTINAAHRMCSEFPPPCVVHVPSNETAVCLYNLADDPAEKNNLASDPTHSALIAQLVSRLDAAAATGPPLAVAFPPDVGPINATAKQIVCNQEESTGFLEPLDWHTP